MPFGRSITAAIAVAVLLVACERSSARTASAPTSPQAAVDELLDADRAFAAASARTDMITVLSSMFAADVVMPVRGGGLAMGSVAAIEALRSDSANLRSRLEWAPVRGGISADGQHGFTFGYMTMHRADSTPVPLKYLAYWIRRPEGWRVVAWKRGRRPAGEVSREMMPPALPPAMVAVSADSAAIGRVRESLAAAERAFSDTAQQIGLGPAFEYYGSDDAVNLGGPNDTMFVVGSAAIGRAVSGGGPSRGSPVSWGPDHVIVASSGDLGVTFGMIRPNAPASAAQGTDIPFFTIWRRESPTAPWRYVAE